MKKRLLSLLTCALVVLCATTFVSCDNTPKWESKMQEAIGKGDYTKARVCAASMNNEYKRKEAYDRIARSQIAFLINSGNVDQAYSIAQEEGLTFIFFETFMSKLTDVYQSVGKMKVLEYLTKVEFEHVPDLTDKSWAEWDDNAKYNKEATKYNTQLGQFMTYVDFQEDRAFNTQLLNFFKPTLEEATRDRNGNYGDVIVSNQAQLDIKKKLGL